MHTVELDLGYMVEYIQLDDEQYHNLQQLYYRAFQLHAARLRAQQQAQQQQQQPRSQASPATASTISTPTTTVSSSSLHSSTSATTTVTIDGSIIEVDGETGRVRVRSSSAIGSSRRGSQRRSSRHSPHNQN
ncbi:hypothetical protein TWF694_005622 [Orbilia ellipsospora]|uniref:Uncharacterized protein n=1 Tax=Orbilia ellipsospora TaxID=2528407 RepID=A0AAV9WZN9_9PEZI